MTDANEVLLFRRYDIMRRWAENGLFDLIPADHDMLQLVASRLYDDIGWAVTDFMTRGAPPGTHAPAARSGSHE